MRKYIIGGLVGFCLSFAVGTHAEVKNMINKVVEGTFPVTVDGKKLESDAVVIEGSTYLPVRSFGEAIGYNVGFNADLGVSMTKSDSSPTAPTQPSNVQTTPTPAPSKAPVMSAEDKANRIKGTDYLIQSKKDSISRNENLLIDFKNNDKAVVEIQKAIQRETNEIVDLEKQKIELSK